MTINSVVELLTIIGALSTTGFGVFGIGSKTRNDDGSLTRSGKVAIIGLAVGLLITISLQFAEQKRATLAAKADAIRLEKLVRSSLYGALTISDARMDIIVRVALSTLREVDAEYSARLLSSMENTSSCTRSPSPTRISDEYIESCMGYEIHHDFLGDREVRFGANSALLPNPSEEEYAYSLLRALSVVLETGEIKIDDHPASEPSIFYLWQFSDQATFTFDGQFLEVSIRNVPLTSDYLNSKNISSMVDFAGQSVNLYTSVQTTKCSDHLSKKCKLLNAALNSEIELWRFAVMFPHRRDLVYDRIGSLQHFQENHDKRKYKYLTYTFPTAIEDFAVADRKSLNRK
jgi:hypothetical protein